MKTSFKWLAVLLRFALALSLVGCGSTYTPRVSHRVSMTMQGGKLGYTRDGHFYPGGVFGGELEQAVAGNEVAMEHARTYRSYSAAGFGLALGGLGVVVIGDLLWSLTAFSSSSSGSLNVTGLIAILSVGLSVDILGLCFSLVGLPHMYDAMNVYNDGVEFGQPPALVPMPVPAPQMQIGPVQTSQQDAPASPQRPLRGFPGARHSLRWAGRSHAWSTASVW